jgi:hypothetical protein
MHATCLDHLIFLNLNILSRIRWWVETSKFLFYILSILTLLPLPLVQTFSSALWSQTLVILLGDKVSRPYKQYLKLFFLSAISLLDRQEIKMILNRTVLINPKVL